MWRWKWVVAVADFLGIDFGTTNSSVAGFNGGGDRPVVACNAEGHEKTPSVVYFGESETLVGAGAANVLADSGGNPEAAARVIRSVKRSLVSPPYIAVPGGRKVRPAEVAAQIIGKLKADAEQSNGGGETSRAVITCPAIFDAPEQQAVVTAAQLAGFAEVELVEEPVAAALAFEHAGGSVGKGVLVYDFGGGTFDVAFVVREEGEQRFYLALEPDGDPRCGGDDIDQALYDFFDRQARAELGRPISGRDGVVDLHFLRTCQRRKETLSKSRQATFSVLLSGGVTFTSSIDRDAFEELIAPHVDRTVRLTQELAQRATSAGYSVDTVLLVGGSSQLPIVERRIAEALEVQPRTWGHRDLAVALGAAYHGASVWAATTLRPKQPNPEQEYRRAVELVWSDGRLTQEEADRLNTLAAELRVDSEAAARVEREVMGMTTKELLERQGRASWATEGPSADATSPKKNARAATPPKPHRPRALRQRAIAVMATVILVGGGLALSAGLGSSGRDEPVTPVEPTGDTPSGRDAPDDSGPAQPTDTSQAAGPSEADTVDRMADILALSGEGRQLSQAGRFDEARDNRQAVLDEVDSLIGETDHLGHELELLRTAAQASIAAVDAYAACGGTDCAPSESEEATAAKQDFVDAFNPLAQQHLGETYEWSDL
jgi:actin-like ATPase involved in cell morphogenesis